MRRFFCIFAAVLAGAAPLAAQPFSQSMAQCAGLLEAVQSVVPEHESIARIEAAAVAFSQAAAEQARAEGRDDPEGWVATHRDAMRADWTAFGGLKVFSQDFVDRSAHCRSIADDRGIDMSFD